MKESPQAPDHLDAIFSALADPTRRAILAQLAKGPAPVTELARPFEMSQPAISRHLKVLEKAGLIARDTDAQRRPARLEARPLAHASDWLHGFEMFWTQSLDQLDVLLTELQTSSKDTDYD